MSEDNALRAGGMRDRRAGAARNWLNWACILGGAVALISLALGAPRFPERWRHALDLGVVAGLAGLVAYGELVSRYSDSPTRLFAARPTPIYILVNMAAGIAALVLIGEFGLFAQSGHPGLFRVMLASFGSIAFFRTSLFTARVGGTDVGIGPSVLLQSLLDATDRMIDRDQAEGRAVDVAGIMRDVDFTLAQVALPTLCFALVEYQVTPDKQKTAREQIDRLALATDVAAGAKSVILGTFLIRLVGAQVLDQAVMALRPTIAQPTLPGSAPTAPA